MEVAEDILQTASNWLMAGKQVALATVVKTWGSSPCPCGSQLVVNAECDFVGSVSGGCIESAVIRAALAVMSSGKPQLLEYGVTNDAAWEVGLACGGRIQVYVEPVIA